MKFYSFYTYKTDPSIDSYIETFSEKQIIEIYYEYWKGKMISKFGKEQFELNYSEKDCINDWIIVHWAWESTISELEER